LERREDKSRLGGKNKLKSVMQPGKTSHEELPWKVPPARLAELRALVSAHQYLADPVQISQGIVSFSLAA